jgi:hypothetical protein
LNGAVYGALQGDHGDRPLLGAGIQIDKVWGGEQSISTIWVPLVFEHLHAD